MEVSRDHPADEAVTLADEDIETRALDASPPMGLMTADDADDSGDDTGDDTGDVSDTSDTDDDSGDDSGDPYA